MEFAVKVLERASKTRMDILHEVNSGECVKDCGKMWLQAAIETLTRNNVTREDFSRAILESLVKRRGKHRNILIIGPANSGKTFMLNPLCVSAPKNHSPEDFLLEKTCRYLLHPFLKSENTKTTLLMNKKVK